MLTDYKAGFNPDPIVRRQVAQFLEPFDVGMVTTSVAVTVIDPVIYVTASTFPDDTFKMDGRELYTVGNDLNEMANYIGYRAGHYFARLRESVPSNIELGEN